MLLFEIKKAFRKKTLYIIVLVSFLISIFNILLSQEIDITIENEYEQDAYGNIFLNLEYNSSIIKNLTKIDKENLLSEIIEHHSNFHYPWDESYIDKEIYALNLTKSYIDEYLYQDGLVDKYDIKLDQNTEYIWEWGLFENEYFLKTNTASSRGTFADISKNPFRLIIFNDSINFGIVPIILLLFLFSGIISREKQMSNINLLKSQPISDYEIIYSKWICIVLNGIIFIIFTIIFTISLSLLVGMKWHNGHLEIYRIFSENNLDYTIAYKLLINIIFASIIMMMFFASIIILFSVIFNNRYIPALLLSFIIILFLIITNKYDYLRGIYNPFYLLNFKNIINGYISTNVDSSIYAYSYVKSYGIYPYFIYLIFSQFILILSVILFRKISIFVNSKEKINNINSIYSLEFFKIVKDKSLIVAIFGILSLFLLFFIEVYIKDYEAKNVLLSKKDTPLINHYVQVNVMPIKNEIDNFIFNKEYFLSIYDENEYYNKLDMMRSDLEIEKNKLDQYSIESDYFSKNDGTNFYKLRIDQMNDVIKNDRIVPTVNLKNFLYTSSSIKESLELYKYMSNNNSEPKVLGWPIFGSEYEEKTMLNEINGFDNVFDHSASYIIRKLLKTYSIDLIILLLVSFMVLGGYAFDKESGNQIDLLFTQPINKSKIYLTKLMTSFFVAFLAITCILLFIKLLGLVTSGIGDIYYPIIKYGNFIKNANDINDNYFYFIPIWKYNLSVYIILLVQILFIISIGNLISIFVKSKMSVYFSTLFVILFGLIVNNNLSENIKIYSPFTYLNTKYVANGAVYIRENLTQRSLKLSILVLLIYIVFINIVGVFVSRNKKQC